MTRSGSMRGVAVAQVLVGLTLVGVLGALAAGWQRADARFSRRDQARALVDAYSQAVMEWQERHPGTTCPPRLQDVRPTGLQRPVLQDPWGAPLVYRCPATESTLGFDLLSTGPDRREDTADDIRGWE